MDDDNELLEDYRKQIVEIQKKELNKNLSLIQSFIDLCINKQLKLTLDNFEYIQTIGIVSKYPNIVNILNQKILTDKEELIEVAILDNEFKKESFASGFYYSDKYMVMAHPYFRRAYYENNNFTPKFIDVFWKYNKTNIQKYISIDNDRVRIDVDNSIYMEKDMWFGAKFKKSIADIEDGIIKLRPPLDLQRTFIDFLFGSTYSLDIKWYSKDGMYPPH